MRYILVLVLFFISLVADREGGPYIGLGYGVSEYKSDGLYATLKENKSEVSAIYAGAYINKYLSVELNYVDYSVMSRTKGYEVNDTKTLEFYSATVATLVHYAFYDDILDVYAKFGVGEMRERVVDAKGFTFVYGMGTSLRLGEMISVKIAYDIYSFGYDEDGDDSSDYSLKINNLYTAVEFQF